mmetsp:Transcript_4210/g.10134  ORF Transcript_4210/g.10134 Transcript_4210/m.10134 type:complete len:135 (+) Transcript_4210:57-461(+)
MSSPELRVFDAGCFHGEFSAAMLGLLPVSKLLALDRFRCAALSEPGVSEEACKSEHSAGAKFVLTLFSRMHQPTALRCSRQGLVKGTPCGGKEEGPLALETEGRDQPCVEVGDGAQDCAGTPAQLERVQPVPSH